MIYTIDTEKIQHNLKKKKLWRDGNSQDIMKYKIKIDKKLFFNYKLSLNNFNLLIWTIEAHN